MSRTYPRTISAPNMRTSVTIRARSGTSGGAEICVKDTYSSHQVKIPWRDLVAVADELVDMHEGHESRTR